MTYVVTTLRGTHGTPQCVTEYLSAIRYDRYRMGDSHTHTSHPDLDGAFKFQTLAAAEMAAVFVGGEVLGIEDLTPGYYEGFLDENLNFIPLTPPMQPGEYYAGVITGPEPYHLILIAEAPSNDMNWKTATEWAAHIGGSLPTRREQSLLFANLKDQFEDRCYWSGEQPAPASSYAWYQYFNDGFQHYNHINNELRARAVRRIPISGESI